MGLKKDQQSAGESATLLRTRNEVCDAKSATPSFLERGERDQRRVIPGMASLTSVIDGLHAEKERRKRGEREERERGGEEKEEKEREK